MPLAYSATVGPRSLARARVVGNRRLLSGLAPHQAAQRRTGAVAVRSVLEATVTEADNKQEIFQTPTVAPLERGGTSTTTLGGNRSSARVPADIDRERFQLHWSVDMWRDYWPNRWFQDLQSGEAPTSDRLRRFTETLRQAVSSTGIFGSTEAAAYWAYHLTRSGFFMIQGVASLLVASRTNTGDKESSGMRERLGGFVAKGGWAGPVGDAMLTFYQDFELIKEGKYALPWDMTTSTHRQFNPLYILQRSATFIQEAASTLARRDRGQPDPVWLKSSAFPQYYEGGFHYQTDGWLSTKSASVYETSTETLFIGRQDAMQRTTLVPISDFMKGKDASQMKALEVAAGTGRFATFVKDNYPKMHLTVSDLSPFYLQEARRNAQYWKQKRAPDARLGGVDDTGCSFLLTKAEEIDAPDNSFDVVYCIYLFHELPEAIRRRAAAEMARVCKPGGLVVLTDSCQLGDRLAYDATLGNFTNFNEPYYQNFISSDLGALFEAAGLVCGSKVMSSSTKALSFFKPLPLDSAPGAGTPAAVEAPATGISASALAATAPVVTTVESEPKSSQLDN